MAAASPRASAHASSLPAFSENASAESLALQACDDVDSLHAVQPCPSLYCAGHVNTGRDRAWTPVEITAT
ncbi:hypothetical protein CY658_11605 [Variovorax sp. RO1]|nr:hypothetical protein CY658_11605 [Variovorax sp. RO1]